MDRCSPNKTTLLWTVWSPQYKLSGLYKCLIVLLCCLLTGISGKSQVLFALVFTTRYLDLLTSFISLYNTTMKVKHSHLSLHPAGLFPSIKHTVFRLNKYTKSTHLCLLKDDVSQQDVTNWLCSIYICDGPAMFYLSWFGLCCLCLSGHLHWMCVRHRVPDLPEVQGNLWREPRHVQSGVPGRPRRWTGFSG